MSTYKVAKSATEMPGTVCFTSNITPTLLHGELRGTKGSAYDVPFCFQAVLIEPLFTIPCGYLVVGHVTLHWPR